MKNRMKLWGQQLVLEVVICGGPILCALVGIAGLVGIAWATNAVCSALGL